jgi:hypothetical protein
MEAPLTFENSIPETDQTEIFLLKRRKLELLRKKVELRRASGISYYKPHLGQDAFHRAAALVRKRYVRTGNRWGKSTAGCAEDISWLLNERPFYPETDSARLAGIPQRPLKLLTVTTDWEKVNEIWTSQSEGKMWTMMPSGFVKKPHRNSMGVIDKIDCTNGSLWRFESVKGFKYDAQGAESSDWDAIHYDEPIPEKMRKALARGLIDRGGSEWYTLTPLTEFWINDYFFPDKTDGKSRDDVWTITGTTYDNIFLSPENIASYEADLNEDERQCRIQGIPLELAGLVYKEFSWPRHVLTTLPPGWSAWNKPPSHYTIYYAIDPHPRTPHAVLFCAVSPIGTHFYFTDFFKPVVAEEMAKSILDTLRIDRKTSYRLGRAIMDPLGFIEEPSTKTNMATELANYGIYVDKATKALDHGIIRVKQQLAQNAIFFTPNCTRTLWEIQRYCWDSENERPMDENDHMMENLYRLELSNMRWVDPVWSNISIPDIEITRPALDMNELNFND